MGKVGIALLALGVVLLAVALVLCLLPGPIDDCGSLLAPMFPVHVATRCPASQDAHLVEAVVAGLSGLGALSAGVILRPQKRRRRSRRIA